MLNTTFAGAFLRKRKLSAALNRPSIFRRWRCRRVGAEGVWHLAHRLGRDRTGAIAVIAALAMTMLCGVVGLAVDLGVWYHTTRAMQNAADAATIAASQDQGNYVATGNAVAAQYGFVNGTGGVTVTVVNNATCPSGQTNCYQASISQPAPQFFSAVLGIAPNTLGAKAAVNPNANPQTHQYCLLALAGSGTTPGILANGVPKADMTNCTVMSNTDMTCNGHNLNATYGDAHGVNGGSAGCGITQTSYVPVVTDPYSYLAPDIPANTCGGSYPQEPAKKKDPALPASNQWSGAKTLGATTIVCGDLQLTGNVTLTTASPGSVLVIENGQLDTNGNTLSTVAGSALTIIFSGTSGTYTHAPTGGGTLDFKAPTTGTWSGMAIYQDPALTTGVDISAAGNSPTWKITGMVYLPHSSVTFSGAVGKSDDGAACFGMTVDNITFNGTGSILATGGCAAAGLALPTNTVKYTPALVQ